MKVALHICCAVCAAGAAERLLGEGHQVLGFFSNSNIHPQAEYLRRLENARKVARQLDFPLTEDIYAPEKWSGVVNSLENEPEGGKRCPVCFRMRLERSYRFLLDSGCDVLTTTLTMGSNKSAELIGRIGQELAGDKFWQQDFKKKEGFKRAGELARKWDLYRQNYCGCLFSLRDREARQGH
jgi:epoxyqueuosine reductase